MNTVTELCSPITDYLRDVRRVFDDELASDIPCVRELCEHAERFRGKMLRPILLLLTAKACGRVTEKHVALAAVVEMMHMATLVHDDVLDEAEIRRGAQSINYAYGNEAAVMLGDYLISHAFNLCSSLGAPYASRLVGSTANTVCEGELMQIHNRGNYGLTEQQYFDIISRKTASLTGTSSVLGAKYAGADAPTIARMEAFGLEVGTAFQIVDDTLDITGTEQEMGKSLGRDADKGKLTLPLIRHLETASARQRAELVAVLECSESRPDSEETASNRRDRLGQLLESSGALAYADQAAQHYVRSAIANLDDLPPSDAKDTLQAVAEFVPIRRA